ncbi:hypothetical protein AFLA_012283 [Aspergillus flavus NRRL3357]|nr:hypothetical protein AFLA_012283 [Aspergillus flavus NRRL3357]
MYNSSVESTSSTNFAACCRDGSVYIGFGITRRRTIYSTYELPKGHLKLLCQLRRVIFTTALMTLEPSTCRDLCLTLNINWASIPKSRVLGLEQWQYSTEMIERINSETNISKALQRARNMRIRRIDTSIRLSHHWSPGVVQHCLGAWWLRRQASHTHSHRGRIHDNEQHL